MVMNSQEHNADTTWHQQSCFTWHLSSEISGCHTGH